LAYDDTHWGAWNLVGNPFACNATSSIDNFYVINGSEVVPSSGTIAPMQSIFVMATGSGQSVTFTSGPKYNAAQALNISLSMANSNEAGIIDCARIRFDESDGLEKFQLNPNHTKIYIPQDGKDYAVVNADSQMGEIPVSFKAENNGRYTLTIDAEEVSFSYLHLIDNRTGADVDLLVNPSYTFESRTTDYESRFKLVFASNNEDGSSTGSETFAFFSNGSWFIANEGEATLQVVDVMGRVLSSETIYGSVSKAIGVAPGVYILKLNDKEQKIIIY